MHRMFQVLFLEDAAAFLEQLDEKARYKVLYNIWKAQATMDKELFKKLTGDIWEFRTLYNKINYRLFAFWDKEEKNNTVVISTHGIIKKTGKVPAKEIAKAEKLMEQYFYNKMVR